MLYAKQVIELIFLPKNRGSVKLEAGFTNQSVEYSGVLRRSLSLLKNFSEKPGFFSG